MNGGYKVLLNVPSSQLFSSTRVIFPGISWNEFYDYDTYTHGGWFFTIEAGIKFSVYKRLGIYCSGDYSLWRVAGDHHSWEYQYLAGNNGVKKTVFHDTWKTLAYVHAFLFRVGIVF
jgi:hypothetical protein